MGLTNQFLIGVTADPHKRRVAMRNLTFGVGAGDQQLIARKVVILLRYRQIQTHALHSSNRHFHDVRASIRIARQWQQLIHNLTYQIIAQAGVQRTQT